MGRDPQQRPGAVRGGAEFAVEHVVPGEFHRGAVDRGDLQAFPQQADPEVRVRGGGVELEQALHDLLAEQFPGLGERAAGRDIRARPGPQAGQPERRRQHRVIAGPGNRHATRTQTTVIFAVSTRSYLWPDGASRSARAITSSASSSSSRPCRPSSASHSVQNPGPDATRAAVSAAPDSSSPRGAGEVDAGATTMANLAGNKAPGGR